MAHVLLIEPDRVLAEMYLRALKNRGHDVDWAPHAQGAIDLADKHMPDIVVLELQLVSHSGIEFLYEFRSYPEWQAVPAIAHTYVPPTEFAGSKLLQTELGIVDYLYKPHATLADLTASVARELVAR
jgi:DNA-binding response OmpR family regulator